MLVKSTNVNHIVNTRFNESKIDRKERKAVYFVEAWNRNEAMRKAIKQFEWDYPYYDIKIIDIKVELISDAGGYDKNYYKVTIIYGSIHDDGGGSDIPFLP